MEKMGQCIAEVVEHMRKTYHDVALEPRCDLFMDIIDPTATGKHRGFVDHGCFRDMNDTSAEMRWMRKVLVDFHRSGNSYLQRGVPAPSLEAFIEEYDKLVCIEWQLEMASGQGLA